MNIDMIQQLAARSSEFSTSPQRPDAPDDGFAARLEEADASAPSTAVDGTRSSRGGEREESPVSSEPEPRGQERSGGAEDAECQASEAEASDPPTASESEPKPQAPDPDDAEGEDLADGPSAATPIVGPVQTRPASGEKPIGLVLPTPASGQGGAETGSPGQDGGSPPSSSLSAPPPIPRAVLPPVAPPPVIAEESAGSADGELPQLIRSLARVTQPTEVKPAGSAIPAEAAPVSTPPADASKPPADLASALRLAPGAAPSAGQGDAGASDTSSDARGQTGGRQPVPLPPLLAAAEAETAPSASASSESPARAAAPQPTAPTPFAPTAVNASALLPEAPTPSIPVVTAPAADGPDLAETQVESQRVAEQALRGLRSVMGQRGGNVTLQLHPRELGSLRIQVQLDAGVVRAQFIAANESSQGLLQQQLGTLRTALQAQGLVVDQLSVQSSGLAQDSGADAEQAGGDEGRSRGALSEDPAGGGRGDANDGRGESDQSDFERELLDLVA